VTSSGGSRTCVAREGPSKGFHSVWVRVGAASHSCRDVCSWRYHPTGHPRNVSEGYTHCTSWLAQWLRIVRLHCLITRITDISPHNLGLISNLMYKILVYLHIIHLLKSSTCFEHYPAHLQEVYVVIVCMKPLVSSLCEKWVV